MENILPEEAKHLVFVYGTLKRNEPNHKFWSTATFDCYNNEKKLKKGRFHLLGTGKTVQKLPLVIATKHNVPFLLHKPGEGHHVEGEIYCVDDTMLELLDDFEDAPNYYKRLTVEIAVNEPLNDDIRLENDSLIQCSSYQLTNFKPELLNLELYETYSCSLAPPYTEMDEDDDDTEYYNEVLILEDKK